MRRTSREEGGGAPQMPGRQQGAGDGHEGGHEVAWNREEGRGEAVREELAGRACHQGGRVRGDGHAMLDDSCGYEAPQPECSRGAAEGVWGGGGNAVVRRAFWCRVARPPQQVKPPVIVVQCAAARTRMLVCWQQMDAESVIHKCMPMEDSKRAQGSHTHRHTHMETHT